MTRTQAIAEITRKLAALDDEHVKAIADIVDDLVSEDTSRKLTAREHALIKQSKEDFKNGRTFTIEEARAQSDRFVEELRDKHRTAP